MEKQKIPGFPTLAALRAQQWLPASGGKPYRRGETRFDIDSLPSPSFPNKQKNPTFSSLTFRLAITKMHPDFFCHFFVSDKFRGRWRWVASYLRWCRRWVPWFFGSDIFTGCWWFEIDGKWHFHNWCTFYVEIWKVRIYLTLFFFQTDWINTTTKWFGCMLAPALETCQDIICIGDGLSLAGCEKARSFHDDDRNLQKGCLYN